METVKVANLNLEITPRYIAVVQHMQQSKKRRNFNVNQKILKWWSAFMYSSFSKGYLNDILKTPFHGPCEYLERLA